MLLDDNGTYILNPAYAMKNDPRRVVIFSGLGRNSLSARNWESFLHPLHAKIFSFFTFNRPLNTAISLLSRYLDRDEPTVRKIVFPFIENPLSVYTRYKEDKVFNIVLS